MPPLLLSFTLALSLASPSFLFTRARTLFFRSHTLHSFAFSQYSAAEERGVLAGGGGRHHLRISAGRTGLLLPRMSASHPLVPPMAGVGDLDAADVVRRGGWRRRAGRRCR